MRSAGLYLVLVAASHYFCKELHAWPFQDNFAAKTRANRFCLSDKSDNCLTSMTGLSFFNFPLDRSCAKVYAALLVRDGAKAGCKAVKSLSILISDDVYLENRNTSARFFRNFPCLLGKGFGIMLQSLSITNV